MGKKMAKIFAYLLLGIDIDIDTNLVSCQH
jgi:hypothetical protein